MNIKTHFASLVVVLASTGSLMSATETERLRALCAEQEMQIHQLEEKIAQLTDTPPPVRNAPTALAETKDFQPVSEKAATYTVKSGDNIERIARLHGTTAAALAKRNGFKTDAIIYPGQKLKVSGENAVAENKTPSAPTRESRTHTVAAGETFYKISMKYGVSLNELVAANPSVNPKALRVGQKVKVEQRTKEIVKAHTPVRSLASNTSIPILNNPAPVEKPRTSDRPIRIEKEITYGQFASKHGTTTRRLDELNGLELDPSTVLAQGSELYTPAQP